MKIFCIDGDPGTAKIILLLIYHTVER